MSNTATCWNTSLIDLTGTRKLFGRGAGTLTPSHLPRLWTSKMGNIQLSNWNIHSNNKFDPWPVILIRLPQRCKSRGCRSSDPAFGEILGVEGEAVVLYREPSTMRQRRTSAGRRSRVSGEMRYPRLSRRVNKMAAFSCFQDVTCSGFQQKHRK
jgi:hypothetical protein